MRTVTNADKIVLLKDGVVKEQGSPKELLGKNSIFKDMVNKQQESMGMEIKLDRSLIWRILQIGLLIPFLGTTLGSAMVCF